MVEISAIAEIDDLGLFRTETSSSSFSIKKRKKKLKLLVFVTRQEPCRLHNKACKKGEKPVHRTVNHSPNDRLNKEKGSSNIKIENVYHFSIISI